MKSRTTFRFDSFFAVWHPWQTWRAPSWEEIAAAEAKDKTEIQQP